MPPLARTLNLAAIHGLTGFREDPALVPRFPVGARRHVPITTRGLVP